MPTSSSSGSDVAQGSRSTERYIVTNFTTLIGIRYVALRGENPQILPNLQLLGLLYPPLDLSESHLTLGLHSQAKFQILKLSWNGPRDTLIGIRLIGYIPKLRKIFSLGPTPQLMHRWRWNLAWIRPRQISPIRCNVSPLRGEKFKNHPLCNRNTGVCTSRSCR